MATKREREKREIRKSNSKSWGEQAKKGKMGSTAIRLPEGVEFYKLTVGKKVVDFMPYITGEGNPRADKGFQHFEREYTDHRVPTPDGQSAPYLCLWANFKEHCPICKVIQDKNTGEDLKKSLKPTLRHLWLINDKPGDEDNTLKVFVSNHYNKKKGFGEQMAQICADQEEGEDFSDLENGKSVKMEIEEETGGGFKYNLVTRIDLVNRKHTYSEDMIDKCPCLDDMLVKPDPKELEKLLNLGSTDDTEEPEPEYEAPKSSAKKPVKEEESYKGDEGEVTAKDKGITLNCVVEHEELGMCTVVHISNDGTALRLKDSDGEVHKGVEPADCEVVDTSEDSDDEPEEKPVAKKSSKKVEIEDDDLLDDSSEDFDDEPEEKPTKKTAPKPKAPIDDDEDEVLEPSDLDDFEDSELDEEPVAKKPVRQSKR